MLNAARANDASPAHAEHAAQLAARGIAHVQLEWLDSHTQPLRASELAQCVRAMHLARHAPLGCLCQGNGVCTDAAAPAAAGQSGAPATRAVRCASVLVHCAQGRSRSATIVTAYVAALLDVPVAVALALVQRRRSIASPNLGFLRRLYTLEQEGFFRTMHAELVALTPPTVAMRAPHLPLCPPAHPRAPTTLAECDDDPLDLRLDLTLDLTLPAAPPPPRSSSAASVLSRNAASKQVVPPAIPRRPSDDDAHSDVLCMELPSPHSRPARPRTAAQPPPQALSAAPASPASPPSPRASGAALPGVSGPVLVRNGTGETSAKTITVVPRTTSLSSQTSASPVSSTTPVAEATSPVAVSSASSTPKLRLRVHPPQSLAAVPVVTVPLAIATAPAAGAHIARSPTGVLRIRPQPTDSSKSSGQNLGD